MKTIKEWLNDLPEEVREKALRNARKDSLDVKRISFKKALAGAFIWYKSPEGHKYWNEIYLSL